MSTKEVKAKALKVIEAINELVDDASMPYVEKLKILEDALEADDRSDGNFDEFMSWFEVELEMEATATKE